MPPSTSSPEAALAAQGATKRYRRRGPAALDDCTFSIPAGAVCALVGTNGAGKSTLMEMAAGMERPTAGALEILGEPPRTGHPRVAYLAQDRPLFPRLTVAETLRYGARANQGNWDAELAERAADLPRFHRRERIGDLSGGQRTRVALALALGKRADLLLLDEPMADLDVVSRQEVMGLLMAHVADTGSTVIMSSHIISELSDVCDHLLVLDQGRPRLCGDVEGLLADHAVVTFPGGAERLAGHTVLESRPVGRGTSALIRTTSPTPDDWEVRSPSLEELVLAGLNAPGLPDLAPSSARHVKEFSS
ncbi:ABC transporter ATP-binding protein [Streptomyces sp. NPDC059169]|uniref:ABC transporter ATP-binding protein n=1 Tax=Streptomyces sp. NPDC059169 TaxID=3346754 RepID=UPI0036839DA6